jgi:vacuolar protein sorting-associated protein 13A/C
MMTNFVFRTASRGDSDFVEIDIHFNSSFTDRLRVGFSRRRDKKLSLTINDARRLVDPMEIGNLVPFKFNVNHTFSCYNPSLMGSCRTVNAHEPFHWMFVQMDISKYCVSQTTMQSRACTNPSVRDTSGLARSDTAISSAEAFEAVTEEVLPTFTFDVDFAGIGISLVNRRMVEVVYVSMDTLKFEYSDSAVAQAVNLSCGTLEIDNQLHEALYPVILQPTPIVKQNNGVAALPTVQGSVIWLKDQGQFDISGYVA